MVKEGTAGESKSQIDSLVGDYEGKKYENNSNMSFANAMFIRNSYKDNIKQKYIDTIKSKYSANVIYDSFENPDNLNNWVKENTFNMIDNLFDESIREKTFILTNALAIDMEWENVIQTTCPNFDKAYSVSYEHEDYSEYIEPLCDEIYPTLKFNNIEKAKSVEIGASINRYDIVNDIGKENIYNTITKEYNEWLNTEGGCGFDPPAEEFVPNFIDELNSNYNQVDASTDFMIYNSEEEKAFAKDLKEYNNTTLEYIGIMPKGDINEYIKEMDSKKISNIVKNLKSIKLENFTEGKVTKITGKIPLFKFDYELSLMDDLKTLGVKDIFDRNKANFSVMTGSKGTYVDASHKANIEFSNEGIKAAAATQFGGVGAADCKFEHLYDVPLEVIDMTFDKPYIFLIYDKDSKEVWFTGKVYEPIQNNNG